MGNHPGLPGQSDGTIRSVTTNAGASQGPNHHQRRQHGQFFARCPGCTPRTTRTARHNPRWRSVPQGERRPDRRGAGEICGRGLGTSLRERPWDNEEVTRNLERMRSMATTGGTGRRRRWGGEGGYPCSFASRRSRSSRRRKAASGEPRAARARKRVSASNSASATVDSSSMSLLTLILWRAASCRSRACF